MTRLSESFADADHLDTKDRPDDCDDEMEYEVLPMVDGASNAGEISDTGGVPPVVVTGVVATAGGGPTKEEMSVITSDQHPAPHSGDDDLHSDGDDNMTEEEVGDGEVAIMGGGGDNKLMEGEGRFGKAMDTSGGADKNKTEEESEKGEAMVMGGCDNNNYNKAEEKDGGSGEVMGVSGGGDKKMEDGSGGGAATDMSVGENTKTEEAGGGGEEMDMSVCSSGGLFSQGNFAFSDKDSQEEYSDEVRAVATVMARPFDVHKLRESITQGSAILPELEGKECVVVVGKTGTGKTALIHALAGKKFVVVTRESKLPSGEIFQKEVFETLDPLPEFTIGHGKVSQTRFINYYKMVSTVKEGGVKTKKELYVLDPPGFEDTEGPEIDIATSVMMTHVAKKARNLRFVILISAVSFTEDRAGAVKGILKLVHALVDDFNASKFSFVFLFTHTNEIVSVAQSNDQIRQARRWLKGEITETVKAEQDLDIKQVLAFICSCLDGGYPFADVFHPTLSNVLIIKRTIRKLNPASCQHLASHCGLTYASKLKLTGELNKLCLELKSTLESDSPDIDKARDILDTFRQLQPAVDIADVGEMAEYVYGTFREFIAYHRGIIHDGIRKGTDSDHEFGASDVTAIRRSFGFLEECQPDFPDDASIDDIIIALNTNLEAFAGRLSQEIQAGFHNVHHQLDKLRTWSEGFSETKEIFNRAIEVTSKRIAVVISHIPVFEDRNQLESASSEWIENAMHGLTLLEPIVGSANRISIHLDVSNAVAAFHKGMENFLGALESWCTPSHQEHFRIVEGHEERAQILVTRAKTVTSLAICLDRSGGFPNLRNKTVATQQFLLDNAARLVNELCAQLEQVSLDNVSDAKRLLCCLSRISQAYQNVGAPAWNETLSPYTAIISSFKSQLQAKSGELSGLTEDVQASGVVGGHKHANALRGFLPYGFFDSLVMPHEQFVANCSIAYVTVYQERLNLVTQMVDGCLKDLDRRPGELRRSLHSLECIWKEHLEFHHIAQALDKEAFADTLRASKLKLTSFVNDLAQHAMQHSSKWLSAIWDGDKTTVKASTSLLCLSLETEEVMKRLGEEETQQDLARAKTNIQSATATFSTRTRSIFDSVLKYETKANCLSMLAVISGASSTTPNFLPDLDVSMLKDRALKSVRDHANRIHQVVVETSECDLVDSEVEKLEGALVLDQYISGEVSTQLRSLRSLIDQKRSAVEGLVEDLIASQDYNGLREILSPSARTKDQVQKSKFDMTISRVSSSLLLIAEDVERKMRLPVPTEEDIRMSSNGMKALHEATQHLGRYLPRSIENHSRSASNLVNQRALDFAAKLQRSIQNHDFVQTGVCRVILRWMAAHQIQWLLPRTKRLSDEAMADYDKVQRTIENSLKDFVAGYFKHEKNNPNHVLEVLSSLQLASQHRTPELTEMIVLYEDIKNFVFRACREMLDSLQDHVERTHSFVAGVRVLADMESHLDMGLANHIDSPEMMEAVRRDRAEWEKYQSNNDRLLSQKKITESLVKYWKSQLERLDPSGWRGMSRSWLGGGQHSFKLYLRKVASRIDDVARAVEGEMKHGDFAAAEEHMVVLRMVAPQLQHYLPDTHQRVKALEDAARKVFRDTCSQTKDTLLYEARRREFGDIYKVYRRIVVAMPFVTNDTDNLREFRATNQLAYETLRSSIAKLDDWKQNFDFHALKTQIEQVRSFGSLLSDHGSLLHEQVCVGGFERDEWLAKTFQLCQAHFSDGRNFAQIRLFAILDALPSSTKQEINRAYKDKARHTHPDKQEPSSGEGDDDNGAMFRLIKDARDSLLVSAPDEKEPSPAFSEYLREIHIALRKVTRTFLPEQRYEEMGKVLFHIQDLHLLDELAWPHLQSSATTSDVFNLVKEHVAQLKEKVSSDWADRNYQGLNSCLSDLKLMEKAFMNYPNVFSNEWKGSILGAVEKEIISLGQEARSIATDRATAETHIDDFRRIFISMGQVMVELAPFTEFTKLRMCEVLEGCLSHDWGYEYLFKFGQRLQRSDGTTSEDENLVAQVILDQFQHFKEVRTMVWNEETAQKPVEDTVKDIKGLIQMPGSDQEIVVDNGLLLRCYQQYEAEYQSLLGDYLHPDADLEELVKKIQNLGDRLKPGTCDSNWGGKTKQEMPLLVAGVFVVFTILKSGESYSRIASSEQGTSSVADKILMKPHNIQVLTLLCMFGCGSSDSDSLESQLMQIRTGEGKSIILGAAAVVLGLLGFRVRCVCYSEYLSNRDYNLFQDVFDIFGLKQEIKYSKITTYAEDTTAAKGDIRTLTDNLLRGKIAKRNRQNVFRRTSKHTETFASKPKERRTAAYGLLSGDSQSTVPTEMPKGKQTHLLSQLSTDRKDTHLGRTNTDVSSEDSLHSEDEGMPVQDVGTSIFSFAKAGFRAITKRTAPIPSENSEPLPEQSGQSDMSEILLVDEVDVFFGSEFYGQTYNQVAPVHDAAVSEILKHIWTAHKNSGGRRLRMADIQSTDPYQDLVKRLPGFGFIAENEINSMLNEVQFVGKGSSYVDKRSGEEEPYFVNKELGKIGHKVMDGVSYDATYGYRTVFAYMKEAENGNLSAQDADRFMAMQVSCGRFSYSNIAPTRILGVSGTLQAMGDYEKGVLRKYGLTKFLFVPSVYGKTNFKFDKAGDGICLESDESDYFHTITNRVLAETKKKRAVIVFFQNRDRMDQYTTSAFYRKLGRLKAVLTEDMSAADKAFVISKAATAGQITVSTAVFGRGTDFFCKDDRVQDNGGVHVIQTFLSQDISEEIQIQGRTARQGKQGTYQMVLLKSDLRDHFGVQSSALSSVPRADLYSFLCDAREKQHVQQCELVESNLAEATSADIDTHKYFDALLRSDKQLSATLFKDLYTSFKRKQMPSEMALDLAFAVDQTGSMGPFTKCARESVKAIIKGPKSILKKLQDQFPEINFSLRVAVLGFRDVEDKADHFHENTWDKGSHFTEKVDLAIQAADKSLANPFGGADIAEDHLGALHCCCGWKMQDDWTSPVKFIILMTDAPAHTQVPAQYASYPNADNHNLLHPNGLTFESTAKSLIEREIDLFFCSFCPDATKATESEISKQLLANVGNAAQREIVSIPMVEQKKQDLAKMFGGGGYGRHIVFVLDESGSMQENWSGVVKAYNDYMAKRQEDQCGSDLISVVQFDGNARSTVQLAKANAAPKELGYRGGGTCFAPAAQHAKSLVERSPSTHPPVVVFMSDGCAGDASAAASTFSSTNAWVKSRFGSELELHVVAFGSGADKSQLQAIANASPKGKVHTSGTVGELSNIFVEIAGGQDVAQVLQAEVAKRISEAVADRLAIEYLGA